jgi:phospholipase A-2-activating protein
MTAILWEGKEKICVIFGHQQAIWATAFLGKTDILLTGSADKTIKAWSSSADLKETFIGHTDVVRSLSSINDDLFMSCANDGTLKRWKLGSGLVKSYDCHATYIYSMDWIVDPSSDNKIGFITCSEDRTVRLFVRGTRIQVIPLPGDTSWAVTTIRKSIESNETSTGNNKLVTDDIAIASSTGMVFVFSKDPSRKASSDEEIAFNALFEATQFPPTDIGSRDILEGPEQLELLPKEDGEKGFVRNADKTDVYMYTLVDAKWKKIGFISGSDKTTLGKTEYEGKMYDYLINVDMEDGQPPLKLPFNTGDNPRTAAEAFVQRHNVPLAYLDTIEQFIIVNVCTDRPRQPTAP